MQLSKDEKSLLLDVLCSRLGQLLLEKRESTRLKSLYELEYDSLLRVTTLLDNEIEIVDG